MESKEELSCKKAWPVSKGVVESVKPLLASLSD